MGLLDEINAQFDQAYDLIHLQRILIVQLREDVEKLELELERTQLENGTSGVVSGLREEVAKLELEKTQLEKDVSGVVSGLRKELAKLKLEKAELSEELALYKDSLKTTKERIDSRVKLINKII